MPLRLEEHNNVYVVKLCQLASMPRTGPDIVILLV